MNGAANATEESARYVDGKKSSYNPFRRFARKTKHSVSDDGDGNSSYSPSVKDVSSTSLPHGIHPVTQGHLFSSSETQPEPTVNYESLSSRPVIGSSGIDQPVRQILVQKTSVSRVEAGLESSSSESSLLSRVWHWSTPWKSPVQAQPSPQRQDRQSRNRKKHVPVRKRKVLVVEYGKTDHVSDVTEQTVRNSWDNPHYSEMEVNGYPVSNAGLRDQKDSSALARPLGNALHKLMPQKGTANLRVFFIQDDREAFLCLGHAFHMTFFGHRTNFRAWAVGPTKASEELEKHPLVEYWAEHLYQTPTAFWRPTRSGQFLRTAFGLEYPVVQLLARTHHAKDEGSNGNIAGRFYDIPPVPEICGQRLSVYMQLKRHHDSEADSIGSDLGLGENTLIILDSMHEGVTAEELSKISPILSSRGAHKASFSTQAGFSKRSLWITIGKRFLR